MLIISPTEIFILLGARYIWKRLAVSLNYLHSSIWLFKFLFQAFLITILGLANCSVVMLYVFISSEPNWLALMGNYSLGIEIFMGTSFVITDVSGYVLKMVFMDRRSAISPETKKADIQIRTVIALIMTVILCFVGAVGASNLQIERVSIPIKGLDPRLNGTTIAQISDIHLGPFIGRSRMKVIVERTNQIRADIVVVTGDLADSTVDLIGKAAEPLKNLKTKYGVYFCTGKHSRVLHPFI